MAHSTVFSTYFSLQSLPQLLFKIVPGAPKNTHVNAWYGRVAVCVKRTCSIPHSLRRSFVYLTWRQWHMVHTQLHPTRHSPKTTNNASSGTTDDCD
jgi:hypothetical protein